MGSKGAAFWGTVLAVLGGCVLGGGLAYLVFALGQHGRSCESSDAIRRVALVVILVLGPSPGVVLGARWRVDRGSLIGLAFLGLFISAAAVLLGAELWGNAHYCET